MANRITQIKESDCEFVESLDTTIPGLIELSRQLITVGNKLVTDYNAGEYDPVFVGEMLLLAGFSSLLSAQDCKSTNFAVHLSGLKLKGEELPIQSVYVAMKEGQVTPPSKSARIRRRTTEIEIEEVGDEVAEPESQLQPVRKYTSGQSIDLDAIQAELDAETPEEVMNAVEEMRMGANRFAGEPSAADDPMPESLGRPIANPSALMTLPTWAGGGLRGGRD